MACHIRPLVSADQSTAGSVVARVFAERLWTELVCWGGVEVLVVVLYVHDLFYYLKVFNLLVFVC